MAHSDAPAEPPAADSVDAALTQFADLFGTGRYHDAHEVLDAIWMQTQGPDDDFFKGLIQAAICLHHFQRDNLDGARKLYSGHRRYLAGYLPVHRGWDVAAFLADMQAALRPVVRPAPGAAPPRLDPERAPRLGRIDPSA